MGKFDEVVDYPFLTTMDEVLLLVIENAEEARRAESDAALWLRLKMASRAMRCALELYGTWSAQAVRDEEKNEKHV